MKTMSIHVENANNVVVNMPGHEVALLVVFAPKPHRQQRTLSYKHEQYNITDIPMGMTPSWILIMVTVSRKTWTGSHDNMEETWF